VWEVTINHRPKVWQLLRQMASFLHIVNITVLVVLNAGTGGTELDPVYCEVLMLLATDAAAPPARFPANHTHFLPVMSSVTSQNHQIYTPAFCL